MRPQEPKFITAWRELSRLNLRCCHTCEHFNMSGKCLKFDMTPPADFAASLEQCESWEPELPF